jgi:transposase
MSKLSENQLKEIRKLKKEGFSCNDIADIYHVSIQVIKKILRIKK